MRQLVICWGSGLIISIFVVFLSINYSHNASIGSLTVLLSLPLLPASAIYTLVTSAGEPGWPLYSLMIAFGSVFYSFPVFVIYCIWNYVTRRRIGQDGQ